MALGTSNLFARAIDRNHTLSAMLQGEPNMLENLAQLRLRQIHYANRRTLSLVRALTAFACVVSVCRLLGGSA